MSATCGGWRAARRHDDGAQPLTFSLRSGRVRYPVRWTIHEEPARPVLMEKPLRIEGPDPPSYPPRYSHRQVVAWVVSGLTDKPPMPGLGEAPADIRMRRMVEREIPDREHREQLKAWARAQADEGAFREMCRARGWNRTTALRHVDLALAHLFLVMVRLDGRDP